MEYISRVLMEEEEEEDDDRFEQPALMEAQESLARIMGASSSCSSVDKSWSDMVNMSFLMGTVEARKLLPSTDNIPSGDVDGVRLIQRSRKGGNELMETSSRASKVMATAVPEEEEVGLQEMVKRMMLNDCEVSREEMEDLRAAMKDGDGFRCVRRPSRSKVLQVVDLRTLLIRCAEKVKDDDRRGARELLAHITHHAFPTGDATQRLAHCFAAALEARLAGSAASAVVSIQKRRWPAAATMMASSDPGSAVKFLEAYRLFAATCCFKKVAYMFANMTICRAAEGKRRLHIVDYGVSFGFQWAGLLRMLAARDGGPPAVTITGIDLPQPGFRPARYIEETGRQLTACARELGVPSFKFHAIAAANWDAVRLEIDIDDDPEETVVAVNSVFRLEALVDDSVVVDRPSPRDVSLFYYSAIFDVLDATMPRTSPHRRVLERDVLAPFALNIVACEGRDRTDRFESYRQWQLRMQRAGLTQLPLDPDDVAAVRDMVKKQRYHRDFVLDEDRHWLLQGWKGRILYASSTWVARHP
ncbi:hypothetical protein EJB05_25628, partial [Eragrostis curvula]